MVNTTLAALALVAFSGLVALSGCAHGLDSSEPIQIGQDRPYQGSTEFSLSERARIEEGALWTALHTDRSIRIDWVDHPAGDRVITRAHLQPRQMAYTARLPDGGALIQLDLYQYQGLETVTMAHEFGHALGLVHHDGPGLMNPYQDDSTPLEWSAGDQVDCLDHHVCNQ